MKQFLLSKTPLNLDFGLLLIRVMIAVLMMFYGFEKLTHFSEMAASDFWMKNVNFFGLPSKIALACTIFAEFGCSLLLLLGLFTRLSLFFLLFCMGYIFLVIFPFSILQKGDNGYEFNSAFTYFVIYLGLFFTGPGTYSLDSKIRK